MRGKFLHLQELNLFYGQTDIINMSCFVYIVKNKVLNIFLSFYYGKI